MDVILPDQIDQFLAGTAASASAQASAQAQAQAQAGTTRAPTDLARFSQQLRALSSLNTRLICMEADQPVYTEMVKGVARVLNVEVCALYMLDTLCGQLKLEGVAGAEIAPSDRRLALDDARRPAVQAYLEEYLVHVTETLDTPAVMSAIPDARSIMALPIMGRTGAVGVFVFARREPGGFRVEEVDLASMLTDQMAYQLENYRLVRQLSSSRDAVIHGMARLAESRGGDLGGHIDRICAYAQLLARRLQSMPRFLGEVTDEWVSTLSRAAALHDIGKVAVPDAVLLKPGRLTDEEFAIMRTHATLGADILRDLMITHGSFPMLEMGMEVALCHHERWDGQGYPHRMSGEMIPLSARILAVVDVYDALTSKRVYKAAWSQEETLAELQRMSGQQFQPELVAVFCRAPGELEAIHRRFPD
ncbi:MAG: HD domain-containing protein [Candidatus Krumholzibacteriia bacterium]